MNNEDIRIKTIERITLPTFFSDKQEEEVRIAITEEDGDWISFLDLISLIAPDPILMTFASFLMLGFDEDDMEKFHIDDIDTETQQHKSDGGKVNSYYFVRIDSFTKEDGFLSRLQENVKKWFIENIMPRITLHTHDCKPESEHDDEGDVLTIVDILNSIDNRLNSIEENISKLYEIIENKNDNKNNDEKEEDIKGGRFNLSKYVIGRRELLNMILGEDIFDKSEDKDTK